jgi:hypothetical protein
MSRQVTEAAERLSDWLRRSNGNNAIADYMDKEAIVMLIEHAQKKPEPQLIRVFLEGGLVQAITNIPKGTIVRRIDLDIEGEPESDTKELDKANMPPWMDKRKKQRAYVSDFLPDGTSRAWNPQQTGGTVPTVNEEPPPFGAVRFDGERKFDGETNQNRAERGKQLVALSYLLSAKEEGWPALVQWADTINLDEVPELPLTEALLAVQHYAHRDHIPLYGDEGAWAIAQKQFNEQSGGAAL